MKVKVYMRLGKRTRRSKYGPAVVEAGVKPSLKPLSENNGTILPTVAFAVELDVPDSAFEQAEKVIAEIEVDEQSFDIAAEVRKPEAE